MTFYLTKADSNIKRIWDNAHAQAVELYKQGGCIIELKPYKKNKTRQQEKYWHSCLQIIANETGEDMEDLKVDIKISCGFKRKKRIDNEMVTIAVSSTTLKIDEYGILIDATQALAGDLGIVLPQPAFFGMEV